MTGRLDKARSPVERRNAELVFSWTVSNPFRHFNFDLVFSILLAYGFRLIVRSRVFWLLVSHGMKGLFALRVAARGAAHLLSQALGRTSSAANRKAMPA
jgi:hypothetical protein